MKKWIALKVLSKMIVALSLFLPIWVSVLLLAIYFGEIWPIQICMYLFDFNICCLSIIISAKVYSKYEGKLKELKCLRNENFRGFLVFVFAFILALLIKVLVSSVVETSFWIMFILFVISIVYLIGVGKLSNKWEKIANKKLGIESN